MLYFIIEHPTREGKLNIPWHNGDVIPKGVLHQRVLTIQADGDELEVILEALKGTFATFPVGSTKEESNHDLKPIAKKYIDADDL